MRKLYHHWLTPASRKIRLALTEKRLPFELELERTVDRRPEFLALNPAGEVPVLVEDDGTVVAGGGPIAEYVEEAYPGATLLGHTPASRAETRRLIDWFDAKFGREVTENLVGEKLHKRMERTGTPNAQAIRAGLANIHYHLDYIGWLAERRTWLAGDEFSLADIAAGAHLSCVDYLGDVPWDEHPDAKIWYARIKSRPSFRPLLAETVPGAPPPPHYADLDF
ncbi:glutathione S-transferase family protein [Arenibaculum pallidiluteum]|uniref:glutathione S-transferase family protein n=1 Tax=Arenibaculum pallidiluteum TaxID=2812559 RepID=UPI001A972F34|nr:glutathione S-transferase family protein [Arenibaculum pallidiluteum]